MSTTLEPLVSEERFRVFIEEWNGSIDEWERSVEQQCYRILRDRYELDRQTTHAELESLRATVQAILKEFHDDLTADGWQTCSNYERALALAEKHKIKPKP
jgi:hypothetical protein